MSNISRTNQPTGVHVELGVDNAGVGVDRAVAPNVAVGLDVGRGPGGGARVGASATSYIFPDKNFSPFGSVRYNFGFGGDKGTYHSVGARAGAEYRFNSGVTAGAYVGVDRALGGSGSKPWGAEAGLRIGIHF